MEIECAKNGPRNPNKPFTVLSASLKEGGEDRFIHPLNQKPSQIQTLLPQALDIEGYAPGLPKPVREPFQEPSCSRKFPVVKASLQLNPEAVLDECRRHRAATFSEKGESSLKVQNSSSSSSISLAQKVARLDPLEAARVLQCLFDQAVQVNELFDSVQSGLDAVRP